MLFTSLVFVGLVLTTFVLYYLPSLSKLQVPLLIAASLIFYAYHQPVLLLLLLLSVGINIVTSYYTVYGAPRFRKSYATAGVVLNLGILVFFKYGPLLAHSFLPDYSSLAQFLVTLPLPIGISFFTFQGISLVVDVYREKHQKSETLVPRSFAVHAQQILFFKGFFPQLISGPIVKAHDFIPQIGTKYLRDVQWERVAKQLITGYFLKMVVADNLKNFTFWIAFPYFQKHSTLTLCTMLFGYSCQIFADFAGYSLIAIGLARLFGYTFKDNFNFPYISTSFREFWKRWHISLSSFLMEYLYIPLGGNRKGRVRTYINLFIVMLLGGLWHGAAWSYAVWGGFHGLALVIERALPSDEKPAGTILKVIWGLLVFSLVTLAWLLFKLPDFQQVIGYVRCLRNNVRLPDDTLIISYIALYSAPVVAYHGAYLLRNRPAFARIRAYDYLAYGIMLFLLLVNSGSSGTFIYFQF